MIMHKLIILSLALLITGCFTQEILWSQDIKNPEDEYQRVRTMAFEGKYDAAVTASQRLINSFPGYGDARILLARVYAWQKNYKMAAAEIDTVLTAEPGNEDALSVQKDITLWSKENTPVSTDLRAGYSFDQFSKPYHLYWQIFSAGAGHRFNWGQACAAVNIGNRFNGNPNVPDATEVQIEAEAWPTISKKNYSYLAYAYSPGIYFPRHRAAVELWQVLPAGFAVSGGLNYYYFDRSNFIASINIEKYLRNYWFSAKTYLYFKDTGITTSFFLSARRYFKSTDYFQITLGTGTAPDEPFNIQNDLFRLKANSIRFVYNKSINNKLIIRVGAGYSREEYQESAWRDRFEGNIKFIYALKRK